VPDSYSWLKVYAGLPNLYETRPPGIGRCEVWL